MAEFKINNALRSEVADLKTSCNLINADYESISCDKVSSLKTAVRIINQHDKIKELLDLYKSLIMRDVKDLEDLIKEAEAMDESLSASSCRW